MIATELFTADGKPAGVWYCGECRVVHKHEGNAEQCCKPYSCETCGVETRRYSLICDACLAKRNAEKNEARWAKAEKRSGDEWDGPVVTDNFEGSNDGFWCDIGELLDWLEDEEKTLADVRVYATRRVQPRFCAADLIEDLWGEMHDGAMDDVSDEAIRELQAFLDAWVEKNEPRSWEGDYTVGLVYEEEGTER